MSTVTTWHPGIVLPPIDLTPLIIAAIKAALSPAQTLGLTMWAEARSRFERGRWVSNPIDAMADIANVVDNRTTSTLPAHRKKWAHLDHKGICLARWQFSCWEPTGGPDDPSDPDLLAENFEALMARCQGLLAGELATPKLAVCIDVAQSFIDHTHPNLLGDGVCHYYAEWMPTPPAWAFVDQARTRPRTPVAHRHGHLFFAGVP